MCIHFLVNLDSFASERLSDLCRTYKAVLAVFTGLWYDTNMDKKKVAYFVSRRNVLPWLAVTLLLCSVVIRTAYFCTHAEISSRVVLFQIIFPILANVWFAISVLCSGTERLHRSAIPAILILLFCAICSNTRSAWYLLVVWICYVVAATAYLSAVSGRVQSKLWLLPLFGILLVFQAAAIRSEVNVFGKSTAVLPPLTELFMVFSVFLISCAMHRVPVTDGVYHKTWGDRPDGRLVRTLSPMSKVSPYIMVNRIGASNMFSERVEITQLDRYVHEKRKEGMPEFGILHAILASYVRCVADYPALNRFLAGQKVYTRDRQIEVVMAIKKEMTTRAPDTMISVLFDAGDTAEDVYRKFMVELNKVRASSDLDSGFDNLAAVINAIPGLVLKFTVWLLKTLDYFGLLPLWLMRLSPFHGSMIITSMGSLGIPPIYHHLYDFGNLPVFIAFGNKYRENEVRLDGSVVPHKYVDFCYVCDERICDGFYYAAALKHLRRILLNPDQLDNPPAEVKRDID